MKEIPSPPKIYWQHIFFAAVRFCLRSIQSCIHEVVVFLSQYLFLLIRFPVATLFICLYTRSFDLSHLSSFLFCFFDFHSWKTQIKLVNIEYIHTYLRLTDREFEERLRGGSKTKLNI